MAIFHAYDDQAAHQLAGHAECTVEVAVYGEGESVVVECATHGEILVGFQPSDMADS